MIENRIVRTLAAAVAVAASLAGCAPAGKKPNGWNRVFAPMSLLDYEAHQENARREKAVEERRRTYVAKHQFIDDEIKKAVLSGRITLRMTVADLRASVGEPDKVNRSVGAWGVHEQWVYGQSYLYIENGILSDWQR